MPMLDSLKARLTLGSVAVTCFVLTAVYLALENSISRTASLRAGSHARELSSCFAAAAAEAIAANDQMQLHLVAHAFERNGLAAIRVVGREGEVLYASECPLLADSPSRSIPAGPAEEKAGPLVETRVIGDREYLVHTRAVHFGDNPLGTVESWVDKSELARTLANSTVPVYPIVALGLAAFVGLVFFNLHTPFRTLRRLGSAAERIGSGNLAERVPVKGHDEMAAFCRAFNRMVQDLEAARRQSTRRHLDMIRAMINTVEAKDRYTVGHCLRVGGTSRDIVEHLGGFSGDDVFLVQTAAILHDVGKIGIPDAVLLKDGPLTPAESETVRAHVLIGEEILEHLDSMGDIATWVRHHHERWDGGGYPDRLRGEEIPLASRIIAVADFIDAMRTDRPYRRALSKAKVVEMLEEERGGHFDPQVVDAAIAVLHREHTSPAETPHNAMGDSTDGRSSGRLQPA